MMREDQHEETLNQTGFDKENVNPVSGTLSPRQKKKTSLRSSVLKELTLRSAEKSLEGGSAEVSGKEIDSIFEKLGDSSVAERDFREL